MKPNYSGRLLDKFIVIAAQQTAAIQQNPDDPEYPSARARVLKDLVMSFWRARDQLQAKRRTK